MPSRFILGEDRPEVSASHHVIVGASIAGVSAAVAMREKGFDGSITVIDAENREPYERPPLSKMPYSDKAIRPLLPAETYSDNRIELLLGTKVDRVDVSKHRIVLADGTDLPADHVLFATGVEARRVSLPGADLANVLSLRTASDAAQISTALASGGPLVVVGGGFIGLEAAALARSLGIEVTVVESESLPLLRPLARPAASLMMQMQQQHGARVLTDQTVTEFMGRERVDAVRLASGKVLPAAAVIVGCGVVPNDHLARAAGIRCDGGIVVDDNGRTSEPRIWAAGDVANQPLPMAGGRGRIEHWEVARRHGTAVGASMTGALTRNSELPYFWSDQYEHTLQMYGLRLPGDQIVLRRDASCTQFLAFWIRSGALAAVAGLNESKSVRFAKALIEARANVDNDEMADPATSLRELARRLTRKPPFQSVPSVSKGGVGMTA